MQSETFGEEEDDLPIPRQVIAQQSMGCARALGKRVIRRERTIARSLVGTEYDSEEERECPDREKREAESVAMREERHIT